MLESRPLNVRTGNYKTSRHCRDHQTPLFCLPPLTMESCFGIQQHVQVVECNSAARFQL